jgi:hypothetical protein
MFAIMIKKSFILFFILLFVVSTTGMPLIIHYCKTMEMSSLDTASCVHEVKKTSCCSANEENSTFFSRIDDCCTDYFIENTVEENFVISKTELINEDLQVEIIAVDTDADSYSFTTHSDFSSPSGIPGNKIYLYNSILLI